ncbi:hypothetical protein EUX98_g7889 [Antrodiella citrinella]|uniref:Uncharacterized protein n=1 Tax=Antrodiella citrinella TaxID=2447956 RepID=A0A4S4MKF2_9APHY|nr:hypothetical protein EUX98_g7889 [Antrodiella citrinella]
MLNVLLTVPPPSLMVDIDGDNNAPVADNRSEYSMATVHGVAAERTGLLSNTPSGSYGTTAPSQLSQRRILFNATLKMALIFVLSTAFLGGTLWLALPTLEEADRPYLKIPKTFPELQALNALLKKYRDIYPYRIVICYGISYHQLRGKRVIQPLSLELGAQK